MVRWRCVRHTVRRDPGHRTTPRPRPRGRGRRPGVLAGPAMHGLRGDALPHRRRRAAADLLALRRRRHAPVRLAIA
ncbi:hypothetical protein Ae406Ps2_3273 [Pseudonocardia sp. Ae406_Ps2]|nr:hypothetical protein Ae331Ps2_2654c [Pseudonocardia sp. Ae331_Ps2]OLM03273.1 hypothetical protein Ae406Ps2_3273 [Pseudonocardia sp. Ae406_Ps2]OLM11853.1 hypothetical protein Ae505Ps2_1979c [Pseudonocardia sp. Ae505_Ps2]OLM24833.1 hypothetical protein Ae706Ps2_3266 [Pseudonocardia sp. Ae706_Ps2]